MPQPDLWVTNWFGTSPDKMKIFNGGKEVEPYSDVYWEMVQELADKMKECYSNVILLSPLEHIEFEEKDGTYTFDYSRFDKMIDIFHRAGVLKMLEGGHIAGRTGDWSSQFAPYVLGMRTARRNWCNILWNRNRLSTSIASLFPRLPPI